MDVELRLKRLRLKMIADIGVGETLESLDYKGDSQSDEGLTHRTGRE